MPEAKVLFTVASLVILGLVAWVIMVLRVPREPWARPPLHPAVPPGADEGAEGGGSDDAKSDAT